MGLTAIDLKRSLVVAINHDLPVIATITEGNGFSGFVMFNPSYDNKINTALLVSFTHTNYRNNPHTKTARNFHYTPF
ncbi:hypothetical protein RC083_17665 [Pseudoalteromonas haloplanktis]|uniref:Uncharacterized protein n=1 Tax=Pseudoalteromonas haloplanktis TaxID=228 RepID=A0ABU1BGC8_PSEHA|nr:hypothetical protein [Pseudoalteromonas haloplanktis]MDQ9093410.1 hypothetical protein [Pseudoalteromonas haloplanktis]